MTENHPVSAKDKSRLHQFGKKVLSGVFIGNVLYGGIWNRDLSVADVEELDVSEINAGGLSAKVLLPKHAEEFACPLADGSVNLAGRDQVFRTSTFTQDHPARGEEHHDGL